ncbi:hypothetical protein [Thiomonas bhubaneswarensis]|uniref:DUF4405 domain-containing protein n=1 Tax=Thiomonas bhubaneswarensis TaxID=339866 RepID=A0A0K6I6W8_9BURK|nr:hypothetical protein [Thiomonas bhubaneswarensis]CUA98884.1 hypothetical protein Ga0061069_10868 [Thiomonas bhubaneswarensis]
MKTYPRAFGPTLHLAAVALLGTGLLLVPGALQMRLDWDLPWVLPGGLRVWVAMLHALSFLLIAGLIGAVWAVHVRAGWARRENMVSGLSLLAAFGLLGLSGLGLYYAAGEALPKWSAVAHLLAGGLLPLLYGAHRLGARAAAARAWPRWARLARDQTARASTARTAP